MSAASLLLLVVVMFALGACLGVSGYGGFLVPPLLVLLCGFDDPRRAVAHALLAAAAPSLLGAYLYRRAHRTSWLLIVVLCVGTVPGVLLGRLLSTAVSDAVLHVLIGAAVLVAGIALVVRRPPRTTDGLDQAEPTDTGSSWLGRRWLATVGLGAGVLSGVAGVVVGVGGPLVTTPVLMSSGIAVAPAVGAGLANSVVVSLLGAASLLGDVTLDPLVLVATAVPQLAGVVVGVRLQPRVSTTALTRVVSAVAVAVGVGFIVQVVTQ